MNIVYVELDRCMACLSCERACLFHKSEHRAGSTANIFVNVDMERRQIFTGTCLQCEIAFCMAVCPVEAITRDPLTEAVVVDPETCIGCRMCVVACPLGYINLDDTLHRATKCDLCGGEPKCVQMCMARALHFDSLNSLAERKRKHPDLRLGLRAISNREDVAS